MLKGKSMPERFFTRGKCSLCKASKKKRKSVWQKYGKMRGDLKNTQQNP